MLSTYEVTDGDIDSVDQSQLSAVQQPAQLQMQLPAVELMRVCSLLISFCLAHYSSWNFGPYVLELGRLRKSM